MKKVKVRVRKKGQLTLPIEIRKAWGINEGSELIFIYDENKAIVKPRRRIRVKDFSGALGESHKDEILFSILDPELLPLYYKEKYGE